MERDETINIDLSVIICIYNMNVEIVHTLTSALPPYQKGVNNNIEILIVDNGSTDPPERAFLKTLPSNVRYLKYPNKKISPVFAINWAAKNHARGTNLMLCIDGARIFSDTIFASTLTVLDKIPEAFVYSIGYHIGKDKHYILSRKGYTIENFRDEFKSIRWLDNPRSLYNNSVLAGSSSNGGWAPIQESNAFAFSREKFNCLGGYDERFESSGGGLCNLEIFERYTQDTEIINVCLIGEGTFHQFHGGAATSEKVPRKVFDNEYESIFGQTYVPKDYFRLYFGRPKIDTKQDWKLFFQGMLRRVSRKVRNNLRGAVDKS